MFSPKKSLTLHNEVTLRNEVVKRVNKAKFLDVIVDHHHNWKDLITMISQKYPKFCGTIYRIRNNLDIKYRKLYYSHIHPYLTYCINLWSLTYQINLKSLITALNDLCADSLLQHSNLIRQISLQLKKFYPLINCLNYRKEYLLIKWTVANNCKVTFSAMDTLIAITN